MERVLDKETVERYEKRLKIQSDDYNYHSKMVRETKMDMENLLKSLLADIYGGNHTTKHVTVDMGIYGKQPFLCLDGKWVATLPYSGYETFDFGWLAESTVERCIEALLKIFG